MWLDRDAGDWRKLRRGDWRALQAVARRWGPRIQRLCWRMCGDWHLAEDLTQETFLRLWQNRQRLEGKCRPSTYLWRIAVNLCCDTRRRLARQPPSTQLTDFDTQHRALRANTVEPLEALTRDESCGQVRAALSRLPDGQRAVLVLRHFEGLKLRDIAEVLELPLGTVASRLAKGLDRLAAELTQRPEHAPHPSHKLPREDTRKHIDSPARAPADKRKTNK